MKLSKSVPFIVLLVGLVSSELRKVQHIVHLSEGADVVGFKDASLNGKYFYSYLRIPFAKPPIGNRRFKKPVAAEPWKGVLDGNEMPNRCPQIRIRDMLNINISNPVVTGNEDCLYLNVHTPLPNAQNAKLPVMVFIHGGHFLRGAAEEHTPHVLLNEKIVFVVIQYRLGVLGFLSTEDDVLPGNNGLKDQQLALKWIQKNIIYFGGDPDKVTIFGESAGGASVHLHMLSPGSKGLFQRVIAQSGNSLCPWAMTNNHKKYAMELGQKFNCFLDNGTESFLACLRGVEANKFVRHMADTFEYGFAPLYALPRVDGDFLPDRPEILVRDGKYHKVDFMSGITKDEGSYVLMMLYLNPTLIKGLNENFPLNGPLSLLLFQEANPEFLAEKAYRHYLQKEQLKFSMDDENQLIKLYGDRYFGVSHDIASLLHAHNNDISVYIYELTHEGLQLTQSIPGMEHKNWVGHLDDLFYLFSGGTFFDRPLTKKEDLKLRDIIISLWTNFAKTGNPTPSGSEFIWEKAVPENMRQLNLKLHPAMEKYNKSKMRKFWLSLETKQNENLLQGITKNILIREIFNDRNEL